MNAGRGNRLASCEICPRGAGEERSIAAIAIGWERGCSGDVATAGSSTSAGVKLEISAARVESVQDVDDLSAPLGEVESAQSRRNCEMDAERDSTRIRGEWVGIALAGTEQVQSRAYRRGTCCPAPAHGERGARAQGGSGPDPPPSPFHPAAARLSILLQALRERAMSPEVRAVAVNSGPRHARGNSGWGKRTKTQVTSKLSKYQRAITATPGDRAGNAVDDNSGLTSKGWEANKGYPPEDAETSASREDFLVRISNSLRMAGDLFLNDCRWPSNGSNSSWILSPAI
ncbi:hypothetical protein C8R44DRAFT_749238 [Mycena epipterygia]|nr:hypothetical protein C8R44DRAFT_749238 [Mycena epipterygia]